MSTAMNITREQAICMFFYEEFNDENIARLSKKIDDMGNVELCYLEDPTEPYLVSVTRILGNPIRFHRYLTASTTASLDDNSVDMATSSQHSLTSASQVIKFLNEVFIPYDPHNDEVYELSNISVHTILSTVWKHSRIFDNKSVISFTTWCSKNKVHFVQADRKRKRDQQGNRYRVLFVAKEHFISSIVDKIVTVMPKYQLFITNLKKEGYQVVGYARKSPGEEKVDDRIRLLKQMVGRLQERSLVDKVFISSFCKADDKIAERDLEIGCDKTRKFISEIDGTMQDLISYLATTKKVCLVVIDFAGLSTNVEDLFCFIRNNGNIEKIIVDCLPFENNVKVYERSSLLKDTEALHEFSYRQRFTQRSK
ncbi:hypothetical protein DM01DRAFT_1330024 [Hesseltinella vesiculosa]|uniref:Uncharacterized protein n=1 Tax=Hesseltinella vesiculosa TaxID=101127 RepID=A0A1X2G2A6_9FUNG|nr:hypothetical protein DM01DRAFT_1330024 [Hesseltinella vesiculosa]